MTWSCPRTWNHCKRMLSDKRELCIITVTYPAHNFCLPQKPYFQLLVRLLAIIVFGRLQGHINPAEIKCWMFPHTLSMMPLRYDNYCSPTKNYAKVWCQPNPNPIALHIHLFLNNTYIKPFSSWTTPVETTPNFPSPNFFLTVVSSCFISATL